MDETILNIMHLSQKASLVRKWSLISTTEAGSGHPTSCLSAADVMTVLFDRYYSYDLSNPYNLANDRLIFSKGHAAPLFYTLYACAGAFPFEELRTLRRFSSRLEGHPTPHFLYTEAATGSLGQGLSVGNGLALGLLKEERVKRKPKIYVLLGDGEMAEGQVWEAANFAGYYSLSNLIAIVDVNGLGQSQETMVGHQGEVYAKRFEAFGWNTIVFDGHDFTAIDAALTEAQKSTKPIALIANTKKGAGIDFLANKEGWHGKPLSKDDLVRALAELGNVNDEVVFSFRVPEVIVQDEVYHDDIPETLSYAKGELVATREIYGKELAELGRTHRELVVLDAEVKNSTYSIDFMNVFPERFIECFIAEQNMISVAVGLARLGKIPFVSTFAAFFTRGFDQIRMARLSNANVKFVGSHAGVSIGEDGTSQMGLEDIAMFAVEPDTVVLHPSDAVSTAKLLRQMVKHVGITYLRTLRSKTAVLYDTTKEFQIGGSEILHYHKEDILTVVACGITVHEALKAYELLKKEGVFIRVVDAYSVKPVDTSTLTLCAAETHAPVLVTVEDHYEHGGLGDAVLQAMADKHIQVYKMAVKDISHSGTKDELLKNAGISAHDIVERVRSLL